VDRFDVVVVGAGPAGSLAARAAAEGGARTLLLDHRPEIGAPVQCGEFLPTRAEVADLFDCEELLDRAYEIPPESVMRETRRMTCVSPFGHEYRFDLAGQTISRRAFDKALAARAEGAGAELRHPLGVTGVHDDELRLADGSQVGASVVVAADGPTSTVGHSLGFRPRRTMYRMITATVDRTFDEEIRLYFGRTAPGGYAWCFPRATDSNVGLGVPTLRPGERLGGLLARFTERESLGPTREPTAWWVPIGPPPPSLVVGRALFVGDAANLVMATNGGGIPTAMLSGWLAGAAAAGHVGEGAPLSDYDRAWRAALRGPLERAARIVRFASPFAAVDPLLALGMRYIGSGGLDAMMRLRWPARLGGAS
jgi:digeranylgeranylglycerophospholipid reductase